MRGSLPEVPVVRRFLTACLLLALMLVPSGALLASDVAPIFTLDSDDPVLTLPTSRGGPNPTAPFIPAAATPYGMLVVEDTPYGFSYDQVWGIAIVGFTGDWEWSFDGASWIPIASASEAAPLGLSTVGYGDNLMIRFAPTAPGSGTLTFRAWDGADGSDLAQSPPATDAGASSSANGGAGTLYSAETRVLQALVDGGANTAPILTGASPQTFTANRYGSGWGLGQLTAQFTDSDGDPIGIAITGLDSAFGTWYYDLGSLSTPVSLSSGEALLLPPYATLWFSPYYPPSMGLHPGAITCRAWDQTFGAPGVASGVMAQLGDPLTVDIDVNSGNSSPTWGGSAGGLSQVDADNADPQWHRLYDLIASDGPFSDADNDPAGVAIIANSGGGGWEWAIDADYDQLPDAAPVPLPDMATAPAAVLLSAESGDNIIIRYVPILADGGTTCSLSIRAWDQTGNGPLAPDGEPSSGDPFSVGESPTGVTTISIDVIAVTPPNDPPSVIQPADILAVAGQPWAVLVTVSDADDDSGLALYFDSAVPNDLAIGQARPVRHEDGTSYRTFTVSGYPSAAGTVTVPLHGNDGTANSSPASFTVTIVAAADTVLSTPVTIAASTAASPVYGAIAPGSTANFQALNSAFSDLFPDRARGVWWNGGYRDLPTLPGDTMRQGVLLASTVDRPFSLTSIPRQAAPFAITLAANSWSLVGVPPLVTSASPVTVATSHPWDDFRLEDLDGIAQDADTVRSVLEVAYQGGPASTEPFLLDGSSYTRASTLAAGTAYWIPNYSGTSYRLVRTTAGDPDRFGAILVAVQVAPLHAAGGGVRPASSSPDVRSGPPPPPGGSPAPAASADGGGSSCGSGGLAGLLIAGLALLGLRPRRRN